MCIRDSAICGLRVYCHNRTSQLLGDPHTVCGADHLLVPQRPLRIEAVSYTHLDVYKRQHHLTPLHVLNDAVEIGLSLADAANFSAHSQTPVIIAQSSSTPVSYTHLDVYKRQTFVS